MSEHFPNQLSLILSDWCCQLYLVKVRNYLMGCLGEKLLRLKMNQLGGRVEKWWQASREDLRGQAFEDVTGRGVSMQLFRTFHYSQSRHCVAGGKEDNTCLGKAWGWKVRKCLFTFYLHLSFSLLVSLSRAQSLGKLCCSCEVWVT